MTAKTMDDAAGAPEANTQGGRLSAAALRTPTGLRASANDQRDRVWSTSGD